MNYLNLPSYCKKVILSGAIFFAALTTAYPQIDTVEWINKNAHVVNPDIHTDLSEWSFLKKDIRGKNIIGLGEGSHGTHEYYLYKQRIIRYLVEKCEFRLLGFEVPDSMMVDIKSYVQTGQGDLNKALQAMGLYGTEEFRDLFLSLRKYNKDKKPEQQVALVGFDRMEYWADPISRDGFMAENVANIIKDKDRKIILWAHNVHIQKDTTAQYLSLGGHLRKKFGDRYFALALDTYQGSVNVMDQNRKFESHNFQTNEQTLSGMMSKAKASQFYLRFDEKTDPFKGETRLITNIYSNWQELKPLPVRPGRDFDAVLFIKNTTHSTPLKQLN